MKVIGSSRIEGARETHEICETKKGFMTSCGIRLEVVDKESLKQFLNSSRGSINVSCSRCPEHRVRRNLRRVRSLMRKQR
jgi:hypothetical protein